MARRGGLIQKIAKPSEDYLPAVIAEQVQGWAETLLRTGEERTLPVAIEAPLMAAAAGMALAVIRGNEVPDTPENRAEISAYLCRVFSIAGAELDEPKLREWRKSLDAEIAARQKKDSAQP